MNFIPANESSLFIWFFDHYTKWSLKRKFRHLWLKQEYQPSKNSKTVYFLNHNLWWDGLLPLYLNQNLFHQNARALMEEKQMRQYSFFSKIGAFSIDLGNPSSSLSSLRYAVKSIKQENTALYIYPEGKLTPASNSEPEFKEGLAWLYKQTKDTDFVPIAIYSHILRSSKPELYISIGKPVNHDNSLSRKELTELFQQDIHRILSETREVAGFSDEGFSLQF